MSDSGALSRRSQSRSVVTSIPSYLAVAAMFPEPALASRTASALNSAVNILRVLFSMNISLPQPKAAQGVHKIEGGLPFHFKILPRHPTAQILFSSLPCRL